MKGISSLDNPKKEEQTTVVHLVSSPPDGSGGPQQLKDLSFSCPRVGAEESLLWGLRKDLLNRQEGLLVLLCEPAGHRRECPACDARPPMMRGGVYTKTVEGRGCCGWKRHRSAWRKMDDLSNQS